MAYICYIWKPGCCSTAMLSNNGESFEDFKQRVYNTYQYSEGYNLHFSEFNEIY